MSEASNSDIYSVLLDIRGDLGRLEGKVDSHAATLVSQKTEHDVLAGTVQKIQLGQARQRGFVAAISTLGAVAGTALGAAVDYFSRGAH